MLLYLDVSAASPAKCITADDLDCANVSAPHVQLLNELSGIKAIDVSHAVREADIQERIAIRHTQHTQAIVLEFLKEHQALIFEIVNAP